MASMFDADDDEGAQTATPRHPPQHQAIRSAAAGDGHRHPSSFHKASTRRKTVQSTLSAQHRGHANASQGHPNGGVPAAASGSRSMASGSEGHLKNIASSITNNSSNYHGIPREVSLISSANRTATASSNLGSSTTANFTPHSFSSWLESSADVDDESHSSVSSSSSAAPGEAVHMTSTSSLPAQPSLVPHSPPETANQQAQCAAAGRLGALTGVNDSSSKKRSRDAYDRESTSRRSVLIELSDEEEDVGASTERLNNSDKSNQSFQRRRIVSGGEGDRLRAANGSAVDCDAEEDQKDGETWVKMRLEPFLSAAAAADSSQIARQGFRQPHSHQQEPQQQQQAPQVPVASAKAKAKAKAPGMPAAAETTTTTGTASVTLHETALSSSSSSSSSSASFAGVSLSSLLAAFAADGETDEDEGTNVHGASEGPSERHTRQQQQHQHPTPLVFNSATSIPPRATRGAASSARHSGMTLDDRETPLRARRVNTAADGVTDASSSNNKNNNLADERTTTATAVADDASVSLLALAAAHAPADVTWVEELEDDAAQALQKKQMEEEAFLYASSALCASAEKARRRRAGIVLPSESGVNPKRGHFSARLAGLIARRQSEQHSFEARQRVQQQKHFFAPAPKQATPSSLLKHEQLQAASSASGTGTALNAAAVKPEPAHEGANRRATALLSAGSAAAAGLLPRPHLLLHALSARVSRASPHTLIVWAWVVDAALPYDVAERLCPLACASTGTTKIQDLSSLATAAPLSPTKSSASSASSTSGACPPSTSGASNSAHSSSYLGSQALAPFLAAVTAAAMMTARPKQQADVPVAAAADSAGLSFAYRVPRVDERDPVGGRFARTFAILRRVLSRGQEDIDVVASAAAADPLHGSQTANEDEGDREPLVCPSSLVQLVLPSALQKELGLESGASANFASERRLLRVAWPWKESLSPLFAIPAPPLSTSSSSDSRLAEARLVPLPVLHAFGLVVPEHFPGHGAAQLASSLCASSSSSSASSSSSSSPSASSSARIPRARFVAYTADSPALAAPIASNDAAVASSSTSHAARGLAVANSDRQSARAPSIQRGPYAWDASAQHGSRWEESGAIAVERLQQPQTQPLPRDISEKGLSAHVVLAGRLLHGSLLFAGNDATEIYIECFGLLQPPSSDPSSSAVAFALQLDSALPTWPSPSARQQPRARFVARLLVPQCLISESPSSSRSCFSSFLQGQNGGAASSPVAVFVSARETSSPDLSFATPATCSSLEKAYSSSPSSSPLSFSLANCLDEARTFLPSSLEKSAAASAPPIVHFASSLLRARGGEPHDQGKAVAILEAVVRPEVAQVCFVPYQSPGPDPQQSDFLISNPASAHPVSSLSAERKLSSSEAKSEATTARNACVCPHRMREHVRGRVVEAVAAPSIAPGVFSSRHAFDGACSTFFSVFLRADVSDCGSRTDAASSADVRTLIRIDVVVGRSAVGGTLKLALDDVDATGTGSSSSLAFSSVARARALWRQVRAHLEHQASNPLLFRNVVPLEQHGARARRFFFDRFSDIAPLDTPPAPMHAPANSAPPFCVRLPSLAEALASWMGAAGSKRQPSSQLQHQGGHGLDGLFSLLGAGSSSSVLLSTSSSSSSSLAWSSSISTSAAATILAVAPWRLQPFPLAYLACEFCTLPFFPARSPSATTGCYDHDLGLNERTRARSQPQPQPLGHVQQDPESLPLSGRGARSVASARLAAEVKARLRVGLSALSSGLRECKEPSARSPLISSPLVCAFCARSARSPQVATRLRVLLHLSSQNPHPQTSPAPNPQQSSLSSSSSASFSSSETASSANTGGGGSVHDIVLSDRELRSLLPDETQRVEWLRSWTSCVAYSAGADGEGGGEAEEDGFGVESMEGDDGEEAPCGDAEQQLFDDENDDEKEIGALARQIHGNLDACLLFRVLSLDSEGASVRDAHAEVPVRVLDVRKRPPALWGATPQLRSLLLQSSNCNASPTVPFLRLACVRLSGARFTQV